MAMHIVPEDEQARKARIEQIESELDQLREDGVEVTITAEQLAALEAQGYMYDFTKKTVVINMEERISLN